MDKTYLTKDLLMPFFHERDIIYTFGSGQPEQRGWIFLTVFEDRSVSFQIHSAVGIQTKHGISPILVDSAMLDKVQWDAKNQRFYAQF
jgi:hypothetical protein